MKENNSWFEDVPSDNKKYHRDSWWKEDGLIEDSNSWWKESSNDSSDEN